MNHLTIDDINKLADGRKSLLQKVILPGLDEQPQIFIKREDLIHPFLSGNKWHKLKYNLIKASDTGLNTLLTFGGAYSNHIYATAAAGALFGFKTIGLIRGEEHLPLNTTLKFAVDKGMQIHYLTRSEFRKRIQPDFYKKAAEPFGKCYVLPEGGTNDLAVKGCSEIVEEIDIEFDYLCSAVGTGGTLSGLICGLDGKSKVLGFAVLKSAEFLNRDVANLVHLYSNKKINNWEINLDYHFGGYAKINFELVKFINEFENINGIPLDPIYTGKMMFGIYDLIKKRKFNLSHTIIALHTGGLQGIDGMNSKIDKLLASQKAFS